MSLKDHVCICKEGCLTNKTQSSFSVYSDTTNYRIENTSKKTISKYIVDDCILVNLNEDEKCDYLFVVKNGQKEDGYFIELKGGTVRKAINQLMNSVSHLKANISGALYGRIVCSKFHQAPKIYASNNYIRLKITLNENLEINIGRLLDII